MGLDARQLTPLLVEKISISAAETRSFQRAKIVVEKVGDQSVSTNTIERVVLDVGGELAAWRDSDPKTDDALAARPEKPPELAVVETDGGRIRVREPGRGPGVHLEGEGWKETKNACLVNAARTTFDRDPQPEPPSCFVIRAMWQTSRKRGPFCGFSLRRPRGDRRGGRRRGAASETDWSPKRLVRSVVASMACSDASGTQVARESKRRRFLEATAKAFLGDGLPWNWSIWNKHFRRQGFVPILDFLHVLSYLYHVAKALHATDQDRWDQYQVWMRGCWQGEVDQVLEELRVWQQKIGEPPQDAAENDPRAILAKTIHYLHNNRERMKYPEYRQAGMPVTTAWMNRLSRKSTIG